MEESMVLASSSFRDVGFLVKLCGKFNEGSEPLFNLHEFLVPLDGIIGKVFFVTNGRINNLKTITAISTFNKVAPAKFVRVTFGKQKHLFYKTCCDIQKLHTLFQVTFSYSSKKLGRYLIFLHPCYQKIKGNIMCLQSKNINFSVNFLRKHNKLNNNCLVLTSVASFAYFSLGFEQYGLFWRGEWENGLLF